MHVYYSCWAFTSARAIQERARLASVVRKAGVSAI